MASPFLMTAEQYLEPERVALERSDVLINPTAVGEVPSPLTEAMDRGPKLLSYRGTPSITAILLVSTDRPVIEIMARGDQERQWVQTYLRLDPLANLEGFDLSFSLADVYEDVFPGSP